MMMRAIPKPLWRGSSAAGFRLLQRRCFGRAREDKKESAKELAAAGADVPVKILGIFEVRLPYQIAKFIFYAIVFALGGIFSAGAYTYRNATFGTNIERLKADLNFLFDKRPGCETAILHLLMKQSCTHIFSESTNTSTANTASLRYALDTPDYGDLVNIVQDMNKIAGAHMGISHSDLWVFAGCLAVERMGGPPVLEDFRYGRIDQVRTEQHNTPHLLPKPMRQEEAGCLRNLADFCRAGMTMTDYVALLGAHTVGSMHLPRSGYSGSWTATPRAFNNEYYKNLLEVTWHATPFQEGEKRHAQYVGKTKEGKDVAMLPSDIALLHNERTRALVKKYANSEEAWRADFKKAFLTMTELNFAGHSALSRPDEFTELQRSSLNVYVLSNVWWYIKLGPTTLYRTVTNTLPPEPVSIYADKTLSEEAIDSAHYVRSRLVEMTAEKEAQLEKSSASWSFGLW
eukprot:Rhum_TRINITY_DN16733_c0_g1::Rhum_TRINITY_DN16733_c0_g1_i1::g.164227::m.164227/K00428/E1.11.1.5; cytochrome c peroxidase